MERINCIGILKVYHGKVSATSIQRLKARWELKYAKWKEEGFSGFEPVYMWADGIYVKAGLGKDKAAYLYYRTTNRCLT
jgi:hypothetical protein